MPITKNTVRVDDLLKINKELKQKEDRLKREIEMQSFDLTNEQEKQLKETIVKRKNEIADLKVKVGETNIALAERDVVRAEERAKKTTKEYKQTLKKVESQGNKLQDQKNELEALRDDLLRTVLQVNKDMSRKKN